MKQTEVLGELGSGADGGGRTVAADGSAVATTTAASGGGGGGGGAPHDRLIVYALDGDLARRLATDGTLVPGMEVPAQSSFVAASLAVGAAGRVYAAGVASVADARRDDGLLALFNLTSSSSSSAGGDGGGAPQPWPQRPTTRRWWCGTSRRRPRRSGRCQ